MARAKFFLTGFGTFTLLVKKQKIVTEGGSPFKEFHADDTCNGSIGRKSYCKACTKEVTAADVAKGIPTGDNPVIFSKEEIKGLHPSDIASGAIEVVALINMPDIIYLNGTHHSIVPQDKIPDVSRQGLELFFHTLKIVKKVALVRYFDCGKVYNAIINEKGTMSGIYHSSEVNNSLPVYEPVTDKELIKHLRAFARAHIKKFKKDVTKDVINEYQDALQKLAMQKQKEGNFTVPKTKKIVKTKKDNVIDALTESLEAIKNL